MASPFKMTNTTAAAICISLLVIMSCALSSTGEEEEAETFCHGVAHCSGERDELLCRNVCKAMAGVKKYQKWEGKCYTHVPPIQCCCTFYKNN
ncbi:unnamed protein product [Urochloa humidicola]